MRQVNHQKCLVSMEMEIGCYDGKKTKELKLTLLVGTTNPDICRVGLANCNVNFNVTFLVFEKSECTCTAG